jgi:hypothetical protein
MRITRLFSFLAVLAVLAAFAVPAQATLVTLTDANSAAVIDTESSAGMFSWRVDGISELYQQWFWYRIGNTAPESSIDTLSAATVTQLSPRFATISYSAGGLTIAIDYLLTGGTVQSGISDIAETVRVTNTSSGPLDVHFFQYSDFDLDASPFNDSVTITGNNTARQTSPHASLSETVTTPAASRVEAGIYATTLSSLQDGAPTTLNNVASAGPGDVTWAFQWDTTIAHNGTFLISKDKRLDVWVPEPAAILGFGAVLLLVGRKLQKRLAA